MGQGEMTRVVLDTNVVVSALLFGGVPGKLVSLWRSGRIEPLCSEEIVLEYLRVLAYPKFRLSESEIDYLLKHEILPFFTVVYSPAGKLYISEDPADDKFIWCAVAGKAGAIVSGDDHLLGARSLPVLTPAQFLRDIIR